GVSIRAVCVFFFFYRYGRPRDLHSFPTRRSSDLLLMGRDVFSNADPLVIFNNRSFITDKGRYHSVTREFTPDEGVDVPDDYQQRSEEHTSELQSRENLVCRLLLEKKKKNNQKEEK